MIKSGPIARGIQKKKKRKPPLKKQPCKKAPDRLPLPFFFLFFFFASALCASAADIPPHLGTGSQWQPAAGFGLDWPK
jgi:hypothetical protein